MTTNYNEPCWMYARDARDQVAKAPMPDQCSSEPYPGVFQNKENLSLKARSPVMHYPLMRKGFWEPGKSERPSVLRAFYHDWERDKIDVGFHDKRKKTTGSKKTMGSENREFTLANYHPSA